PVLDRPVFTQDAHALAACARLYADHGRRIVRPPRHLVVARELVDGHLDHDRVRVEAAHAVHTGTRIEGEQVRVVEGPEAGQGEHRAQVDEEGIVALRGEDLDAPRQGGDRG